MMRHHAVVLALGGGAMLTAFAQTQSSGAAAGATLVDRYGYKDCIQLENKNTRVVLGPHCGGRVLEYSWKGENALMLDPEQNGRVWTPDSELFGPSAGRFDVGPETVLSKHPNLWLGGWTGEIIGPRQARMTSVEDDATSLQLVRDFTLDASSSHLSCKQTMINISDRTVTCFHWSRTFAQPGGVTVIPLTPDLSRLPHHYVMYGPGPIMNFKPEDPNITVDDEFMLILDRPALPKLAIDSHAGWFSYLMVSDLMFVKRFATYPDRAYGEMLANPISIYDVPGFCELEPIGPQERLAPGKSASYTEEWWLVPYKFPKEGATVDPHDVARIVEREAR